MRRKLSDFEKRWLKLFASEISEKDIEKYVVSYGNYIWHVFSWELKPTRCAAMPYTLHTHI